MASSLGDQSRPVRSLGMGCCCRTQCIYIYISTLYIPIILQQARLNQWRVKTCRTFGHFKQNKYWTVSLSSSRCSITYIANDLPIRVKAHIFRPKGVRAAVLSAHMTESRIVMKCSPRSVATLQWPAIKQC
jgi:hypothetical protein